MVTTIFIAGCKNENEYNRLEQKILKHMPCCTVLNTGKNRQALPAGWDQNIVNEILFSLLDRCQIICMADGWGRNASDDIIYITHANQKKIINISESDLVRWS